MCCCQDVLVFKQEVVSKLETESRASPSHFYQQAGGMSEIVAGFERRVDALKTSRQVGQLFIREAARDVIKAEGVVKIATEEWRDIAEFADMMTPELAGAARNKEQAEQALTSVLLSAEKTAVKNNLTLEYVRSIQHSRMTMVESRVLDNIRAAEEVLQKSRGLIEMKKFALSNLQHVGSLVSVAENAVRILKKNSQIASSSDEEYSDGEMGSGSGDDGGKVCIDGNNDLKQLDKPSKHERGEIEMMTAIQLRAERNLRQAFSALTALEKDYQYAKSFLVFDTDRSKATMEHVAKAIEKAEAAIAIAEWRHERLRGVAPPKFLNAVDQAVSQVEKLESFMEVMYRVNRDDEMRSREKSALLAEDFETGQFREDEEYYEQNERKKLRGLVPSLFAREKRIEQRSRVAGGSTAEEVKNERPLLTVQALGHPIRVTGGGAEDAASFFDEEERVSCEQKKNLLEEAERAHRVIQLRVEAEDKRRADKQTDREQAKARKSQEIVEGKLQQERVRKRKAIVFHRAQGNWIRMKDTIMQQLRLTWKRLQRARQTIVRQKRDRDGMTNEDSIARRMRAVQNATSSMIEASIDSVWQSQGEHLDRETALAVALRTIQRDMALEESEENGDVLTLGVLDCTDFASERISPRQGEKHVYPEIMLAKSLDDTLQRMIENAPQADQVGIRRIRLIPFRCNQGEIPTRPQRKRFHGFVLTSALAPSTPYNYSGLNQGNPRPPRWQTALKAFLRDIIGEKRRLLAIGGGHLFLASAFPGHRIVPYARKPPLNLNSSLTPPTRAETLERAWQCGNIQATAVNADVPVLFQRYLEGGELVLPFARDAILAEVPDNFKTLLVAGAQGSAEGLLPSIDCMYYKTNVLSYQSIPHIPPTLIRHRLNEISMELQSQTKVEGTLPNVPTRTQLQKPCNKDLLVEMALAFFALGIPKSANAQAPSSPDLMTKSELTSQKAAVMARKILIEATKRVVSYVSPSKQHPAMSPERAIEDMDDETLITDEASSEPETKESTSPLRIAQMLSNHLPENPHPVFRHYTSVPKVIACGHTAKETQDDLLSPRQNSKGRSCDAVVIGIVPSSDGTLMVLPSPLISRFTNFDSVYSTVDDSLDNILRNRKDSAANRFLSKFSLVDPGNFWLNQAAEHEVDSATDGLNRRHLWVHDLPTSKLKTLKACRPDHWKRMEGQIVNIAKPSEVCTLQEYLEKLVRMKRISSSETDLWMVPIGAEAYRDIRLDVAALLAEQAYSVTEKHNIHTTIATFDAKVIKEMRRTCVRWKFIQILNNKSLETHGIRPGANPNILRVFMRKISLYADGICVRKEMLIRRPGKEPPRKIIQIKNLKAAVQQMPHLIACARAASLSVFSHCFSSDQASLHPCYKGSPSEEYARFFALGVDGLITQHATMAARARNLHCNRVNMLSNVKPVESPRETLQQHRKNRENLRKLEKQRSRKREVPANIWDRAVEYAEKQQRDEAQMPPMRIPQSCLPRPRKSRISDQKKFGTPRPPTTAAPKFRPMSTNAGKRNTNVYRRGIARISKRNEMHKRPRQTHFSSGVPSVPKGVIKDTYTIWTELAGENM